VKIQGVRDTPSAHTAQETRAYLATKPNRFAFVWTSVHASWLNLIAMFLAKLAEPCRRGIRVASVEELEQRLLPYLDRVHTDSVPVRWRAQDIPPTSSDAVR